MTRTDPTADAFMRRILADPADPVPRLVFADWLEESGTSPNLAWARYLRLADELANAPPDDPRRGKLAADLERLAALVRARLTFRAEVFAAYPESMLRVLPARNLELTLDGLLLPAAVTDIVPRSIARERLLLPLTFWGGTIAVAAEDPADRDTCQRLQFLTGSQILPLRARGDIWDAVERHYRSDGPGTSPSASLGEDSIPAGRDALPTSDDWAGGTTVTRLVNLLLVGAIEARASALLLEPEPQRVRVWHETAGVHREQRSLPAWMLTPVAARLRVLAGISPAVREPRLCGTIPVRSEGQLHQLAFALTAGPHGPAVRVTVPPATPQPPAAVNPAA